ncbi:MAG: hypothetical protein ACXWQ8_13990 [Ktedonobacterales bacterium]
MTNLDRELKRREASRAADKYRAEMDEAIASGDAKKLGASLYLWALTSTVAGFLTMSRPGITFTDEQKARIQRYIEEERLDKAQQIILDEVSRQCGEGGDA